MRPGVATLELQRSVCELRTIKLRTRVDSFDNVGGQAGERQDPADVGVGHALLLCKVGDRLRAAALDAPPPPMCAHERLDQRLVAARPPCRRRHACSVMINLRALQPIEMGKRSLLKPHHCSSPSSAFASFSSDVANPSMNQL
jgi:hypothetical protein